MFRIFHLMVHEVPLASKVIAYGLLVLFVLFIVGINYYLIAGGLK